MNAVLSTAINFQNVQEVKAYMTFSAAALPDGDRRYSDVAAYKVGYDNIVLLDASGYIIAKEARHNYRGLAIDGKPIVINGPDFARIGCDPDYDQEKLDEVLARDVDQAVANGMKYRVAWITLVGNTGFADFADNLEAEAEYEARLKTEKAVKRGVFPNQS